MASLHAAVKAALNRFKSSATAAIRSASISLVLLLIEQSLHAVSIGVHRKMPIEENFF